MNTTTENLRTEIRARLTAHRTDDTVAGIIRRQIGGALMYAGAREYTYDAESFTFRTNVDQDGFMGARRGRFYVTVKLDRASDTYTVSFLKATGAKVRDIQHAEGVYADMLPAMVEAISRGEWS